MIVRKLLSHCVGFALVMLFLIGCSVSDGAPVADVSSASNAPSPTSVSIISTDTPLPPTDTLIPPTLTHTLEPTAVPNPPTRDFHSMAYDIESDKAILFGGYVSGHVDNLKDTWAYDYDTNTWVEMTSTEGPGDRAGAAMVYHSQSDRVILFGGINTNNEVLNDTWAYDYSTNVWTELTPPGSPQRAGHAMAYDLESDRIIMFGGGIDFADVEGTWAYDYNANVWTEMTPDISPPNDHDHQMAYDSESDRIILWETSLIRNKNKSVWAYDFNTDTWEEIEPDNEHPKPFAEGAMAYDVQTDRIILHYKQDLWAYDYNTNNWTELTDAVSIPYLYRHSMVYNTKADRMIAFGGVRILEDEFVGETWVFDLNTRTWTDVTPTE